MEKMPKFRPDPYRKRRDRIREALRFRHSTYRTKHTDCQQKLRCICCFGGTTQARLIGREDVAAFFSHLATEGQMSSSTPRSAFNMLVFLCKDRKDRTTILPKVMDPSCRKATLEFTLVARRAGRSGWSRRSIIVRVS